MALTKDDLKQIGKIVNEAIDTRVPAIVNEAITEAIQVLVIPQLDRINQRLDAVEKRLDAVEKRLDQVEKRLDQVEARLDELELKVELMSKELSDVRRVTQRLSKQELHNQIELKEQSRRVGLLQVKVAALEKEVFQRT